MRCTRHKFLSPEGRRDPALRTQTLCGRTNRIFSNILDIFARHQHTERRGTTWLFAIPNNTQDRETRVRVNTYKCAAMSQIIGDRWKTCKFAVKLHLHQFDIGKPLTCIVLMYASQRYVPIPELLPIMYCQFNDKAARGVRIHDIKGLLSRENATSRKLSSYTHYMLANPSSSAILWSASSFDVPVRTPLTSHLFPACNAGAISLSPPPCHVLSCACARAHRNWRNHTRYFHDVKSDDKSNK